MLKVTFSLRQAATAEVLAELEVHNVSTAPKFLVTLQRLLAAADDEEECHALFEEMQDAIGAPLSRDATLLLQILFVPLEILGSSLASRTSHGCIVGF